MHNCNKYSMFFFGLVATPAPSASLLTLWSLAPLVLPCLVPALVLVKPDQAGLLPSQTGTLLQNRNNRGLCSQLKLSCSQGSHAIWRRRRPQHKPCLEGWTPCVFQALRICICQTSLQSRVWREPHLFAPQEWLSQHSPREGGALSGRTRHCRETTLIQREGWWSWPCRTRFFGTTLKASA